MFGNMTKQKRLKGDKAMNIEDYAIEVGARIMEKIDKPIEVTVVHKEVPNKTLTGLAIKEIGSNIAPTVWINELYEDNVDFDKAADGVVHTYNHAPKPIGINLDDFKDFNGFIKDKLVARLYGKNFNCDVKVSASRYGFDDLIIVPYVDIALNSINGVAKVTKQMLDLWRISEQEVIDIALNNMKNDYTMYSVADFMSRQTGLPKEIFEAGESLINIVSTKDGRNGAIAVIIMKDKLRELFPQGYVVIPASIHEVLVMDTEHVIDNEINNIIQIVNNTEGPLEEQLSDHMYKII